MDLLDLSARVPMLAPEDDPDSVDVRPVRVPRARDVDGGTMGRTTPDGGSPDRGGRRTTNPRPRSPPKGDLEVTDSEVETPTRRPLQESLDRIRQKFPVDLDLLDDGDEPEPAVDLSTWRESRWTRAIPSRFLWSRISDFENPDDADNYQPVVAGDITAWATNPRGRNLLLVGPVGVGKTHAGIAAARARFDVGDDVTFLPVVEVLDLLRPGGPERALENLMGVDLLVLDDLGSEKPTDWTAERLFALINRRWMDEAPTVATSNLPATRASAPDGYSGATLDEALGARTYSRLVGSGAVALRLTGPDRRRTH